MAPVPPISRRLFLAGGAAVVLGACSGGSRSDTTTPPQPTTAAGAGTPASAISTSSTTTTPPSLPGNPFTLGVASGDPDGESVILWTRLAPDRLNGGGMPDQAVTVRWEIGSSPSYSAVFLMLRNPSVCV